MIVSVPTIGKLIETPSADLSRPDGTALAVSIDFVTMSKTRPISFTDEAQEYAEKAYETGFKEATHHLMMLMAACAESERDVRDKIAMRRLVSDMQIRFGLTSSAT